VLVATIAIAALGLAHDPPAAAINAGCLERPTKARAKRTHGVPSPPLAIGDSVMIYSVPLLGRAGLDADARPCRSWVDADRMIRGRAKGGTLPEVVVVALGANGPVTLSTGHPGWFAADGVHLGSKAGIRAYTKLIESADPRATADLHTSPQPASAASGTT
jgi:hypothetical protein